MTFGFGGGTDCEIRHAPGDCVRPQCGGTRRVGRGRRVLREAAQGAGVLVSNPVVFFCVVGVASGRDQEANQQECAEPEGPHSLRHASRHDGSGSYRRRASTSVARRMGIRETH
jgi:hypothetical protein